MLFFGDPLMKIRHLLFALLSFQILICHGESPYPPLSDFFPQEDDTKSVEFGPFQVLALSFSGELVAYTDTTTRKIYIKSTGLSDQTTTTSSSSTSSSDTGPVKDYQPVELPLGDSEFISNITWSHAENHLIVGVDKRYVLDSGSVNFNVNVFVIPIGNPKDPVSMAHVLGEHFSDYDFNHQPSLKKVSRTRPDEMLIHSREDDNLVFFTYHLDNDELTESARFEKKNSLSFVFNDDFEAVFAWKSIGHASLYSELDVPPKFYPIDDLEDPFLEVDALQQDEFSGWSSDGRTIYFRTTDYDEAYPYNVIRTFDVKTKKWSLYEPYGEAVFDGSSHIAGLVTQNSFNLDDSSLPDVLAYITSTGECVPLADKLAPMCALYSELFMQGKNRNLAYGVTSSYLILQDPDEKTTFWLHDIYTMDNPTSFHLPVLSLKDPDEEKYYQTEIKNYVRDELELTVYVNTPKDDGITHDPLPFVVLPHGGPHVYERYPFYHHEANFLASRGIGSVLVNFRGTLGNGSTHEKAGQTLIGRKEAAEDVIYVTEQLIEDGVLIPGHIAIQGASFGGYITLWAMTNYPDLYQCGIASAAISDVMLVLDEEAWGKHKHQVMEHVYGVTLDQALSDDKTKKKMVDTSPLTYVEKLQNPVLLTHGKDDANVPYEHSQLFFDAAVDAGKDITLVSFEQEGHSIAQPNNAYAEYALIEAFLLKNLNLTPSDTVIDEDKLSEIAPDMTVSSMGAFIPTDTLMSISDALITE